MQGDGAAWGHGCTDPWVDGDVGAGPYRYMDTCQNGLSVHGDVDAWTHGCLVKWQHGDVIVRMHGCIGM